MDVYETFVVRRNRTAVVCEASMSPALIIGIGAIDRQTINDSLKRGGHPTRGADRRAPGLFSNPNPTLA
jgi:hypothetical protein